MAHRQNKYQSREQRTRVREVLLRQWDPIGICDIPEASDEYDAYADEVHVMLMDGGAGEQEIAAYLFTIATDRMGLGSPWLAERTSRVARTLSDLRSEFTGT